MMRTRRIALAVAIPTYNNASTIVPTLESIAKQTIASEIHLSISDDCSTDETRTVVENWLKLHAGRFKSVEMFEAPRNGGVSANHLSAVMGCVGTHILYLGGDDRIVSPEYAARLVAYLSVNWHIRIAKTNVFVEYSDGRPTVPLYRGRKLFFALPHKQQFKVLSLLGNILLAGPGTIIMLSEAKNWFDPDFRLYEDLPLFYRALLAGFRIHFIDIDGPAWLRHQGSLSTTGYSSRRAKLTEDARLLQNRYERKMTRFMTPIERLIWEARRQNRTLGRFASVVYWPWYTFRLYPRLLEKIARVFESSGNAS